MGLLVCSSGGAIAFADETDTTGGTTGTGGTTTTNTGSIATIRSALATLRDAFSGDAFSAKDDTTSSTSTLPTSIIGNQRVDEEPVEGATTTTGTTDLTNGQGPASTLGAQTNTSADNPDVSNSVTLDTDVVESEAAPTSTVSTAVVEALTPILETLAPSTDTNSVPSDPNAAPGGSGDPAESGAAALAATTGAGSGSPTSTTVTPPGSVQTAVVEPLSNAVMTVVRAFGEAGLTLASLPASETPITDVITAVQILLTAVVEAVSEAAQIPGNLLGLLGFPNTGSPPSLVGAGGSADKLAGAPADAPLIGHDGTQFAQAPIAVDAPLFGNVVNASEFGGITPVSLNQEFALSGLAPAPSSVTPATASFLDNVVRSVLVPASLTALAAIAVPGIAGLLIVCAAGIRVGYRQAKAGLALRVAGIARFAGPGPMGVVRAGSLITLHARSSRLSKAHATKAVPAKTADAPRLLESVA